MQLIPQEIKEQSPAEEAAALPTASQEHPPPPGSAAHHRWKKGQWVFSVLRNLATAFPSPEENSLLGCHS